MKASIVIPNLNGAGWLKDSIESIRAQTFRDFELIVVDNGSEDESLAIARSYVGQEGYTLIENGRNTGFSHAVNQGIRAAKGEYVVLFNNDAFAEPQWLEELVAMAGTDEKIFAVQSLMKAITSPCSAGHASAAMACIGSVIQSRSAFFPPAAAPVCTANAFWMR